jgi:hypothetical protein
MRCPIASPIAFHREVPGFISFATVEVAQDLTTPRIVVSWNELFDERTSFK